MSSLNPVVQLMGLILKVTVAEISMTIIEPYLSTAVL